MRAARDRGWGTRPRCAIALLLFLVAFTPAHSGCADGSHRGDTPIFGPRHRGPSWAITGDVAYEDLGILCVRPDGGLRGDPRLAGLRVVSPGPGVNERVLPWGHDPDWGPDGDWFVCEVEPGGPVR